MTPTELREKEALVSDSADPWREQRLTTHVVDLMRDLDDLAKVRAWGHQKKGVPSRVPSIEKARRRAARPTIPPGPPSARSVYTR